MVKKKKALWLGYLEAGGRSSPVVRDESLETGNPGTIYLFNFMKGRILEYRREIVEPKLRELTPEESSMRKELRSAFQKERDAFTPRAALRPVKVTQPRKKQVEPEIPDLDDDQSWPVVEDDDDEMPEGLSADAMD